MTSSYEIMMSIYQSAATVQYTILLLRLELLSALADFYSGYNNCNRRLPITMYSGNVCTAGRPNAFWERFLGNALRMVGVGCELDAETRGIDVTRRAESIGEGIRV